MPTASDASLLAASMPTRRSRQLVVSLLVRSKCRSRLQQRVTAGYLRPRLLGMADTDRYWSPLELAVDRECPQYDSEVRDRAGNLTSCFLPYASSFPLVLTHGSVFASPPTAPSLVYLVGDRSHSCLNYALSARGTAPFDHPQILTSYWTSRWRIWHFMSPRQCHRMLMLTGHQRLHRTRDLGFSSPSVSCASTGNGTVLRGPVGGHLTVHRVTWCPLPSARFSPLLARLVFVTCM